MKDPRASLWWNKIDPNSLSRHGYIAYAFAAQRLGKYNSGMELKIEGFRAMKDDAWYWSQYADDALYAQLLVERGDRA